MGKLHNKHIAIIDKDIGAEGIYQRYLELGGIKAALESFTEEAGRPEGISIGAFYKWMDQDETGARRREWERVKQARGMGLTEEALELADLADSDNYNAQRLKVDTRLSPNSGPT